MAALAGNSGGRRPAVAMGRGLYTVSLKGWWQRDMQMGVASDLKCWRVTEGQQGGNAQEAMGELGLEAQEVKA